MKGIVIIIIIYNNNFIEKLVENAWYVPEKTVLRHFQHLTADFGCHVHPVLCVINFSLESVQMAIKCCSFLILYPFLGILAAALGKGGFVLVFCVRYMYSSTG